VYKELKELALRKLTFLWTAPDWNSESAKLSSAYSRVTWLEILDFWGNFPEFLCNRMLCFFKSEQILSSRLVQKNSKEKREI
jgi:hypothetical protein